MFYQVHVFITVITVRIRNLLNTFQRSNLSLESTCTDISWRKSVFWILINPLVLSKVIKFRRIHGALRLKWDQFMISEMSFDCCKSGRCTPRSLKIMKKSNFPRTISLGTFCPMPIGYIKSAETEWRNENQSEFVPREVILFIVQTARTAFTTSPTLIGTLKLIPQH